MKVYIEAGYNNGQTCFRATRTIAAALDHYIFVASCLASSPDASDSQRAEAFDVLSTLAWYRKRRWQLVFGRIKVIYFSLPLRYGRYQVCITTTNPWNPPCQN